jgi:hypothetical protein
LRHFNERTEASRIQSSRHWETSTTRVSSDVFTKHPFVRSSSDRTINRRRPEDDTVNNSFHSPFDSHNQAKSSSLSTIITKRTQRTNYNTQRTFVPMPTTTENHSQLNNDGE